MYDGYHFSPAIKVGDMVWVSGQVGSDASGVTAEGAEEQSRIAFANLEAVLEAAGATLGDIVELVTFHTDFHRDIGAFVKIKDEILTADFPAWTAVGVSQLARPEYLVEIRAVAVIGSHPA
jgi:enamine deaminase RidA (YjgF/YER057c/UK114 family)